MRGLGLSAKYVVAIVAVYLAERFPLTGVLLMMLLGPFWIALIVNAWMVELGVCAWLGYVERGWLALPVFFYVGYEGLVVSEYLDARAMRAAVEQANVIDTRRLPPGKSLPLVIDLDPDQSESRATLYAAAARDDVAVYVDNHLIRRFAFGGDECRRASYQDNLKSKARFKLTGVNPRLGCYIAEPAATPQPAIHIRPVPPARLDIDARLARGGFTVTPDLAITEVRLVDKDGTSVYLGRVQQGTITFPMLLPLFVAGCALNGGAAFWDCMFGPMPGHLPVGGADDFDTGHAATAAYTLARIGVPLRE